MQGRFAETLFLSGNKGLITFATGQAIPTVTGNETVTGNFIAGGSVSGASAKFTGAVTTGNQTVNGNVSATGSIVGQTASFTGSNTTQILSVTQMGAGQGIVGNGVGPGAIGVTANAGSGAGVGIVAQAGSTTALGVDAVNFAAGVAIKGTSGIGSVTGAGTGHPAIWGDSGVTDGFGVVGTADDGNGVVAVTNSGTDTNHATLVAQNLSTTAGAQVLLTVGGFNGTIAPQCTIDVNANLACNGTKSAVVPVDNGQKMVALYAEESPENWFADYGSGHLLNGVATVTLELTYVQTVNTSIEYHVFLTPKGDCKGLYVTNEASGSFDVHELQSGHSNIAFDYRIIAKRKAYENIRLEDKTAMMEATAAQAARFKAKPGAQLHPLAPQAPAARE